jgi:D-arabinose 1-dehydrogenase-like Zn-dependent alcohol dehydrogenase
MRAAVMTGILGPNEVRDLPRRDPGPGQVRVRIRASGLCGTDMHAWRGNFALPAFPAVLGHEPVGEVDTVGPGVSAVRPGDRVGVSWTQRGCGRCQPCQEERPKYCGQPVTWVENGGGNAEYMIAEETGCTLLPEGLAWEAAAPLFCAGFTVMSGYRNAAPRPGDRVGILGLGGLGHLALQVARAMGHETVAITRSEGKAESLRRLGADEVVVIGDHAGKAVRAIGGVDVILSTSNDMRQNGEALRGLRDEGRFVTMALGTDPIPVDPNLMLGKQLVLKGSMLNDRKDLIEVLHLAALGKVRPVLEVYPLEQVQQAYERLDRGEVRYRAVLVP